MAPLLILGAGGQVGHALECLARREGLSVRALSRRECNILDQAAVQRATEGCGLAVNCAAYTAVDKAEEEAEVADAVNVKGSANVATACQRAGIALIHLSSDYVFDGTAKRPIREDDVASPLNCYGQSKLGGEVAVRQELEKHIILRTSWVFSETGQNFVKTILRLASTKLEIRVVDDQVGGPTAAHDIAKAIVTIGSSCRAPNFTLWGTYHFTGAPPANWCEFARAIVQKGHTKIIPIPTKDYPTPARRPQYTVLDCQQIRQVFGIEQPDWRSALQFVLAKLNAVA